MLKLVFHKPRKVTGNMGT